MAKGDAIPGRRDEFVVHGTFERQDLGPIADAAVHAIFLGDPPTNCGTYFDLDDAPARTGDAGRFCLKLSNLDDAFSDIAPPGAWRRGLYLILAVKDPRTLACAIGNAAELGIFPIRLRAIPSADMEGQVVNEAGEPLASAVVTVERYRLLIGRGPCPEAPVNFWLARRSEGNAPRTENVAELTAMTDSAGRFKIHDVPAMPGSLDLSITHANYARIETCYYPFQPPLRLTLQATAAIHIFLKLPDGQPAPGFRFCLEGVPEGATDSTHRLGETDGAGRLVLGALLSGNYVVRYRGGAAGALAVPAIVVDALTTGERRELTRTAVAGSFIRGKVVDAKSREPIFHAEVRFESAAYPATASTFQAAYTDAEGQFEFDYAVVPGHFDVSVSACERGKWIGRRDRMTVQQGSQTEWIFELPSASRRRGL